MENEDGGTPDVGAPTTVDASKYQALEQKFGRTVEAKKGLEARVAELEAENQQLAEKTSSVDTLARKLQEAEDRAAQASTRFERFRAIAGAVGSTDPDAVEAFEWRYSKLEGDDKPAFEDWLEAMKKDPDSAPTVLRPFLGGVSGFGGTQEGKPKPRPVPGGGHRQPADAPSRYSSGEIKRIREEAVRTGDWSKWEAIRGTA